MEDCVLYTPQGALGLPLPPRALAMEAALRLADVAVERRIVSNITPFVRIDAPSSSSRPLTSVDDIVVALASSGHALATPQTPWHGAAVEAFARDTLLNSYDTVVTAVTGGWWNRRPPTVDAERRALAALDALDGIVRSRPRGTVWLCGDAPTIADVWAFTALAAILCSEWPPDRIGPEWHAMLNVAHQRTDMVEYFERLRRRCWDGEGGKFRLRSTVAVAQPPDEFAKGRTATLVAISVASVLFWVISNAATLVALLEPIEEPSQGPSDGEEGGMPSDNGAVAEEMGMDTEDDAADDI